MCSCVLPATFCSVKLVNAMLILKHAFVKCFVVIIAYLGENTLMGR